MKRCSTSLIIREMKVKTMMRYYFSPNRTAIIKRTRNNKCPRWCGEKGTLLHCLWECKLIAAPIENSIELLQKIKNKTTIRPSNSTPGCISKEKENTSSKRYMHPLCSLQHYLQLPRYGNNLNAHQKMSG